MLFALLFVTCLAAPAWAQATHPVEASVFAGWAFLDGVSGTSVPAPDGNVYNRIDPKDGFKWGADLGVNVNEQVEVGFLFTHVPTKLELGGNGTRDLGNMNIFTYHGYVGYNSGDSDSHMRVFGLFGMGATQYGSVDYTRIGGGAGTVQGLSRFSTTWAVGVKAYPSGNVGFRAQFGWTPTYIKTDPNGGWWCDPYWGCYLVGNAQYAHSLDFTAGLTFRF
jgi:hypothetical protein